MALTPKPNLTRVAFELRAAGVKQTGDPKRAGIHTRGYLPHVKRESAAYFVTFRLADSLPKEVLARFDAELSSLDPSVEAKRELQRRIERYLDSGAGACWLAEPEIAQITSSALRFWHNDRYLLGSWVVMPNHVHSIVQPIGNFTLSQILQSWKRFTAREANKLLNRSGESFWQPESYDHWIRNDAERARIERYIHNNPVKARLCSGPAAWPWSSAGAAE